VADRHPEAARVALRLVDEARVGREGGLARVRCRKGARPRGVRRRGSGSAHPFGAARPGRGEGVAPVPPEAATAAVDAFPAEPARALPAGARAAPVLDGAGRHVSGDPGVPANLTPIHPPAYSPELNPVGRVWEHRRERRLGRRVLAAGRGAVVDAARAARNAPLAETGRLRSLTSLPWLPASLTTSWRRYYASAVMSRQGCGAVRVAAQARRSTMPSSWRRRSKR
jgi:hypothetical protein